MIYFSRVRIYPGAFFNISLHPEEHDYSRHSCKYLWRLRTVWSRQMIRHLYFFKSYPTPHVYLSCIVIRFTSIHVTSRHTRAWNNYIQSIQLFVVLEANSIATAATMLSDYHRLCNKASYIWASNTRLTLLVVAKLTEPIAAFDVEWRTGGAATLSLLRAVADEPIAAEPPLL